MWPRAQRHRFYSVCAALALLCASPLSATVCIEIGTAEGAAGEAVTFSVSLRTMGQAVSGIQNDIVFHGNAPIAARAGGMPDCEVNPTIGKESSQFVFRPRGCSADDCIFMRALILSLENTDPIPDGVLYTCRVRIAPHATRGYALVCDEWGAASPLGEALPVECFDGTIWTVDPRTPRTPGPTPAQEVCPTATPTRDPLEPHVRVELSDTGISARFGGMISVRAIVAAPTAASLEGIAVRFTIEPPVGVLRDEEVLTRAEDAENEAGQVGVAETVIVVPPDSPAGYASVTARALGAEGAVTIMVDDPQPNSPPTSSTPTVNRGDSDGCAVAPASNSGSAILPLSALSLVALRRRRRRNPLAYGQSVAAVRGTRKRSA